MDIIAKYAGAFLGEYPKVLHKCIVHIAKCNTKRYNVTIKLYQKE